MSLATHSRRSRRLPRTAKLVASACALACASLGLVAIPASAGLLSTVAGILPNCGARPTSTAFAAFGDTRSYFLMPGGGFESGAPGWTLAGSKVVSGNESSFINANTDSHSLAIPSGALAVSPTVCVAMGENTIRLFVKNSGVAGSALHVQALVQNQLTGLVLSSGADIQGVAGSTGWSPSSPILIPNLLGGLLGTQNLTLVFTNTGKPATWNIDDVFVDPFRSR
ncbi:MAG: hypothetical protein QOC79_1942 [Actinomycetota bacterium]|nr:hypothetical protein [Actinomycetota bacterium]